MKETTTVSLTPELKKFIKDNRIHENTKFLNDPVLDEIGLVNCKNKIVDYDDAFYLTKRELEEFCENNGIIYGRLNRYTGSIPDNNVIAIKKYLEKYPTVDYFMFEGCRYSVDDITDVRIQNSIIPFFGKYKNFDDRSKSCDHYVKFKLKGVETEGILSYTSKNDAIDNRKYDFFIAAPPIDFNIENARIEGVQIKDDPAIFERVGERFRLITCWGKEQKDLQNPKLN